MLNISEFYWFLINWLIFVLSTINILLKKWIELFLKRKRNFLKRMTEVNLLSKLAKWCILLWVGKYFELSATLQKKISASISVYAYIYEFKTLLVSLFLFLALLLFHAFFCSSGFLFIRDICLATLDNVRIN